MNFFKCSHPAKSLFVHHDSSVVRRDADFSEVTHHLFCMNCGATVDIGYSMLTKTVQEFMRDGMAKRER